MKLSIASLQQLHNGLVALDGYEKDGKRFVFELSGIVRRIIAKNMRTIQGEIEDFQKARNGLIEQHSSSEKPGQVATANIGVFAKAEQELLASEVEVDLKPLKAEELLKGDTNPVPPSALCALDPILQD